MSEPISCRSILVSLPRELYSTSQLLSAIVGFEVQPNKAIVGRNAFAHEAGIHQHGMINNPLCYEIMTPESVGVSANSLVLGKHSGRHALALRYEELGYPLTSKELRCGLRGLYRFGGSQEANLRPGLDLIAFDS